MRPLLEQQLRLLRSPAPYSIRGRVRVLVGSTWHNLSNLFGRDFLDSVDVDEGLDNPVGQASVRVMRELQGLSLAPFMETSRANNLPGSYAPLLQVGRPFRVEAAVVPLGFEPQAPAWRPLFFGRIDRVDSGPEIITFTGRDLAGVLQDVWVPEGTYGSDAGTPLETVCNQLLVAAQLSDFALYTPEASRQLLGKYKQERQPAMDALSSRAIGRGWEVRWKLRPDTGDWGLWLWGPDRAGTTPVWTYGPSDYQYLGEFTTSLENVRTRVEVTYSDAEDLDVAGQPKRKTVARESEEATQRYGYITSGGVALPRTMWLAEASTSGIRTHAEAVRLAEAGRADLSTCDVGASVEVRFHPGLELADLVQLAPNGFHFTTAQVLAVRQVTHTLTSTDGKTRLALNGKPSLGARLWLDRNADGYTAPTVAFTGPAAPSGLAVTNSVTGAVLLFTAPNVTSGGSVPEEYELHVGTAPGFTLSAATLKAVSSSTRFDLTGLAAGASYYARVRSRDRKGNVGPASDEVSLTPRYVAPVDLQPQVIYSSLTPNPSMEAWTQGPSYPPDAWTVSSGTWGTDFVRSAASYSGGYSVAVTSSTTGARLLASQYMSVTEGQLYVATHRYYQPSGTSGITGARMELRWYNASFVELPASYTGVEGTVVGSWQVLPAHVAAPAGARYARLFIGRNFPASLSPVYVDLGAVDVYGPVQETPRPVSSFFNSFASAAVDTEGRAEFYRTSTNEVQMQGAIVPPAGVASGVILAFYVSLPPPSRRRFRVATASGSTVNVVVNPDGYVEVVNPTSGDAVHLCQIRYRLS